MSSVFERWKVTMYYSDTDVASNLYNSSGEIPITNLPSIDIPRFDFWVSTIQYQYTPTNELASDIGGRSYNRNRGFTDGWTLTLTPYLFDPTGQAYQTLAVVDNIMFALKFRYLWVAYTGDGLNALTTGVGDNATKAVKVTFNSWSETVNTSTGTRTATLGLQRKYRFDT